MDKDLFSGNLEVQIYDFHDIHLVKTFEFDLKWIHMAWYNLILRLDRALWLRIISGPLLTQKWSIKIKKSPRNGPPELPMIYHLRCKVLHILG